MKLKSATIMLLVLALASCRAESRDETAKATGEPAAQNGIASWYGHPYHGRQTANGEIYDMHQLTAAHRLLAFGSVVRVTRVSTGDTVDVRINDRGPFVKGRIIDLSHAAAERLKIDGIAEVSVKTLSAPRTRAVSNFAVQVGVFEEQKEAERIREALALKYESARVIWKDGDRTWRVVVGSEPSVDAAESLGEQLRAGTGADYFVVAFDE